MTTSPPVRSSTSMAMNQEPMPGPVATASHTSSTVPGTSTESSRLRPSSGVGVGVGGHGVLSSGGRGWDEGDDAVGAATGRGPVVVAGDQGDHGGLQVAGEGSPVRRGGEPDLGVDREGRQRLAGGACPPHQPADLAHGPGRDGEEVGRRQPVPDPGRVRPGVAHGRGRHDVGGRARRVEAFGEAPVGPLVDLDHQSVVGQGPQVVADPLPGRAHRCGEGGGRARRPAEEGEQP